MKIKVLIVEDQALVRKSFSALIGTHYPHWEIHEAENGIQAISIAREIRPALIFMDYRMPRLDGLEATRVIIESLPQTKIIMVSGEENNEFMFEAVDARVSAVVPKTSSDEELLEAIDNVIKGIPYLDNSVARKVTQYLYNRNRTIKSKKHLKSPLLSDRELEVLDLIAKGNSALQIAERLFISRRTVENHKANMLRKCNVATTPDLLRFAFSNKLISP